MNRPTQLNASGTSTDAVIDSRSRNVAEGLKILPSRSPAVPVDAAAAAAASPGGREGGSCGTREGFIRAPPPALLTLEKP